MTQEEKNQMLVKAVLHRNIRSVKEALALGANPDTEPVLYYAVMGSYNEIVKILLEVGANVNVQMNLERNITPLMRAAMSSNTEISTLLIEAGAEINIADKHGHTPIMMGIMWGYTDAMELLLQAGADINLKDKTGYTALDIFKSVHPEKYNKWLKKRNKKENA